MYLIKKDGLWLLGFQQTGVREFVNGKLTDVYTSVWGSDIHDAKGWEHKIQAEAYAMEFGGDVILVPIKLEEAFK
ncbi:MAG: hypothetical protein IJJ45_01155 [Clostridia bacterium]|nr:hypothetical protein [Clostridia bacterium]